jgi:histidine ammonia-lyase
MRIGSEIGAAIGTDHPCTRIPRCASSGAGEPAAAVVACDALAIQLNQLAAGGSGAAPAWIGAVAAALNAAQ